MANNALDILGVSKSFVGIKVLHEVDFSLKKGEILGLVGENGAGKSTLMNIIGGVYIRERGTMKIDGRSYDPKTPMNATENGIAFIHQELNLFTNLSIAENVCVGNFPKTAWGSINKNKMRARAQEVIERFSLPVTPDTKIESLSAGLRQMVEISKGILKNSHIMIFDEPTTSLSKREKGDLFTTLNELRNKGVSIIYISHILEDVFEICDRITVLRDGRVIGTDDTANYTGKDLIKMMVGREMTQAFPTIDKTVQDDIAFELKNIHWSNKVNDISLALKVGEIVGLYGLMGAGRTELVNTVFGIEKMDSGEIHYQSKLLKKVSPEICIGNDIAYITEDRRHEGLLMTKPVSHNLILVKLVDIVNKFGVIDRKRRNEYNAKAIKDLRIKVVDPETQAANNLSGGNQQKVVFGKWVMKKPKVFILDEPTRGVDVGAKFEIYSIILELAKTGSSVLFISSEMEELIGVCDRILVMSNGSISGEVNKDKFDQETILQYALSGSEV
jgi:ribose transport system ATP-binding protein